MARLSITTAASWWARSDAADRSGGSYEGTIAIEETSALASGMITEWYAPGVGVVMEKAKREQLNLISSTLVSP